MQIKLQGAFMLKRKFQHMREREHYKMYKAGKAWLFANIIAVGFGSAMIITGQTVLADNTSKQILTQRVATNALPNAYASVTTLSASSAGELAQTRSSANAASNADSGTSVGDTGKNTTSTIATMSARSDGFLAKKGQSSVSMAVSQAASAESKIAAGSVSSFAGKNGVRSRNEVANNPATMSTASNSKASLVTNSGDAGSGVSTDQVVKSVSRQRSTSAIWQEMADSQAVVSVSAKQVVSGTKTTETFSNGVKIDLSAGASSADIQSAKRHVEAQHIHPAQITAQDATTDDYSAGESAAVATLTAASYAPETDNNGVDIKNWLGDVSYSTIESQLASANGVASSAMIADAKMVVETWVIDELKKVNWTTLSQSADYVNGANDIVKLGVNASANQQNGYADTIKAYLKGQLTAEAYYLWLLKVEYNSTQSSYFGPQGLKEAFVKLKNDLNVAKNLNQLSGNQANMYNLGFDFAYDWFVGDAKLGMNWDNSMIYEVAANMGNAGMTQVSWTASKTSNNDAIFLDPVETMLSNNPLSNAVDVTSLENEIYTQAFKDYYADWQNVVAQGFKQATVDALAGKALALDNSVSGAVATAAIETEAPDAYKAIPGTKTKGQLALFVNAYILAKAYLSGHYNNQPINENNNGAGNTPIPDAGVFPTTPVAGQVVSPLDLAIYSVLTGKTYTYNISPANNPIVDSKYQARATKDWISGPAQNDMYQLAWNAANQAKTDFLADIQLAVNTGDLSKLNSAATFLPTAMSQGILSAIQYDYYKTNSYVYYKVFSALYKSFFTDKAGKFANIIAQVVADADTYVKQSGDSHNGQPIAQSLTAAQRNNPDLTATVNDSDITLNADVTYTKSYSENADGTPVSGVEMLTPSATTMIKSDQISSDNQNNAKKVIQNGLDYAYAHEETVAIPAYEAGYAAAQKNLNVTPTAGQPALGNLTKDNYQFEDKSTVTDVLTPVLMTTNPNGSTVWQVHYSNADGTSVVATIQRAADATNPDKGAVTGLDVAVYDNQGTVLNDSGMQKATQDSVSYTSVQLNANVINDGLKQTTISVSVNDSGAVDYEFVRDVLNIITVTPSGDGTAITSDGTNSGTLYQAGWNYKKSFISQITLVQQVADPKFENDIVGGKNNKLTDDQTYAGFFQSNDKDGNVVRNSTVQLVTVADTSGTDNPINKTVTNLDGSKVAITINSDGSLTYIVYDVNGQVTATNGSGTLGTQDRQVIITNQDAMANEKPSQVVITRTANDAITITEIGLQDKMINDFNVANTQSTAEAIVTEGKNVEPSFSSTTIVVLGKALHAGVVLVADPKFGTNGIKSTYDRKNVDGTVTVIADNADGLKYHGYVPDSQSTDNTKDYGTAENSTATIQYTATNVSNTATKTTMTVNTSVAGPTVTIFLGKDANGNIRSTTSFDPSKVTTSNAGSEIFEWAGVTNLPAGWTYNAVNQTLTYVPTTVVDKKALISEMAKAGTYVVNWSDARDATAPALIDQYGDVLNLVISAQTKSENSLTVNVDTSDATKVNADHQYTFSNADIVNATQSNDPNGFVTAFIEHFAGTTGKTYEGTMNGMVLPNGVKSITLNADGSVTVMFDPDKATANYDKATNKNVIKLVLPFTVDSNGQYVPDTGDATNKTPLANLTLYMNMQADLKLTYQAAAGGADTTVKNGNGSVNVAYVKAGQELQSAVTQNGLALGSTYNATVPATINAASTANYQGASYKLINGIATNNPTAINFNDVQLTFGGNTSTYLYAKTYGSVWDVTNTAPSLTDVPSASTSDGITATIDLSSAAKDFNWQTVSFQPDENTATSYTTTVIVNKDAKRLIVIYKPKTVADDLDFLQNTYQDGFDMNGWLTDTQTLKGSAMPAMHNALYVKTKTAPLKLADFTKKATVNVAKSGDGYDASDKTYTFDVPSTVLSVKELALLASGQTLTLTSESSQSDLEKGNLYVDTDNWKNITGVTISLSADGTFAHIVATLNTAVAKSNVQKGAVLTLGTVGDSPLASGIHLELSLVNDLKQQSSGLPADLPKESQPVYPTETDQALNSRFVAKSQAVAGYVVVSATDQNNKTLQITTNADGSASYAINYDWGVETGDPVADQITWQYAQAEINGSIGSQTKVYGADDPSTPYPVTLPSWLTAPKWTKDDFGRDNDISEEVGDHNIKLSAQGISDLAAANKNFTIDATTLAKLTDGTLTITPKVTVKYVDQNGNELTGKKTINITDKKKGAAITIDQPDVEGYTIERSQPTSYILTGDGTQTVTVVYRQNASVTANYYVVGTTNKIANSVTTNGGVGLTYSTNAAQIPGYTLVAMPTNAAGTYTDAGNTVNYEYTVDYTIVPVDGNGNEIPNVIAPSGTGTPGQPVAPTGGYPTIPGYTRTTTPNVPDKPEQVNVVYTPLTETVMVNYYIQGTTTPIASSVTLSGPFGSDYQSTPANVSGYKLVTTPANASGMYGVTNGAVNYYYELIVTVVSKTPDGKPVPGTTPTQQPGVPGQPISNVPQIPGYKVTFVPAVPGQPGMVEVIYTPITTPGPMPMQSVDTQTVPPVHVTTPVPVQLVERTTSAQQTTVKMTVIQLVPEVHTSARVAAKSQVKVLPRTGQQSSFALVIAGLGMMAAGFIFLGVRRYLRS